jgi:hypothetical protein
MERALVAARPARDSYVIPPQQNGRTFGADANGQRGTFRTSLGTIQVGAPAMTEKLNSDERWEATFAQSQQALKRLADEAIQQHRAGRTEALDLDALGPPRPLSGFARRTSGFLRRCTQRRRSMRHEPGSGIARVPSWMERSSRENRYE